MSGQVLRGCLLSHSLQLLPTDRPPHNSSRPYLSPFGNFQIDFSVMEMIFRFDFIFFWQRIHLGFWELRTNELSFCRQEVHNESQMHRQKPLLPTMLCSTNLGHKGGRVQLGFPAPHPRNLVAVAGSVATEDTEQSPGADFCVGAVLSPHPWPAKCLRGLVPRSQCVWIPQAHTGILFK